MKQSLWSKAVVGGLIAALALTGCVAQEDAEEVEEAAPVEEVVEQEAEADVLRHPLTGEEVTATATGPVVMAKIDHENRPYVNLHRADIVWQQLIPQNGTRFLAVWHSDVPEEVSFVRSFRPHDYHMASAHGGMLASTGLFSGVIPYLDALSGAGVKNIVWDYRGPEDRDLWTNTGKPYAAANSVSFAAAAAQSQFSTLAPPPQYFEYVSDPAEASAAANGQDISTVTAYFSESKTNDYMTSRWVWDAAEGVFKKTFVNGDPVLSNSSAWDAGAECECVQVSATNLVILSVEHDDVVGQPTARLQDGGRGPAWVATGGKIIEADWNSGPVGTPITLVIPGGEPVKLAPGKTWILVFPGDGSTARTAGWGGPGGIEYQ